MSPPDEAPPSVSEEFRTAVDFRFRHDRKLVEQFAKAGPAIVPHNFYSASGHEPITGQ